MELTFLGTSSMVPTKDRNHSSVLLEYKAEGILIDCGEGTQRQLRMIGIKPNKITKILISHWHGDHVLGLIGLIQSLGACEYSGNLKIYGPEGTIENFEHLKKAFVFEDKIEFEVNEVKKRVFVDTEDFFIEALPLEHGMPCLGYNFVEKDRLRIKLPAAHALGIPEGPLLGKLQSGKPIVFKGKKINPEDVTYVVKGKKVSFISDTCLTQNCVELARDADLLVCEATYADDLEEKAEAYLHLTARQAGMIANQAGVKKLVLTHFSQRYKNTQIIEENARTVFDNVVCAKDFMKIVP